MRARRLVLPGVSLFESFFAKNDLALSHKLIIQPQAVFIGCRFKPWPGWATEEAHSRGRLKNVRRKGAAVDVKLYAEVPGIRNPGNLVAWVEDDYLGNQSNQYWAFSHLLLLTRARRFAISLHAFRVKDDNTTRKRLPLAARNEP